jgi:predicted metalloendopeptidase
LNMPEFLDVFRVSADDGMYVDPEKRIKIW